MGNILSIILTNKLIRYHYTEVVNLLRISTLSTKNSQFGEVGKTPRYPKNIITYFLANIPGKNFYMFNHRFGQTLNERLWIRIFAHCMIISLGILMTVFPYFNFPEKKSC